MDQKTKELWVIPTTISLVVGVVLGVLFMVWGAWYTGVKLHSPFSLVWFETIITARLPMWVTLVACAFGTIMVGLYRGQAARVKDEKSQKAALRLQREYAESQLERSSSEHAAELEKLKNPDPVLHMSWYGTSGWGWGGYGTESVLRIQGDVTIKMENIKERVIFTGVHLEGAEFVGNFDNFKIDPGETTTRGMMLNFRGVHPGADKPLTVQLTFQDLKGTLYQTGPATLRAFPGSTGNPFAPSKVPPAT